MPPDEQYTYNESQSPRPHRKLELFYFETIGNRSYLRLTRLAVILILCMTVIPLLALFTFVLFRSNPRSWEQNNANVPLTVRPNATPLRNIIIQAPTPKHPPKVRQQPLPPAPTPPVLSPEAGRNINRQVQQSPSPLEIPEH